MTGIAPWLWCEAAYTNLQLHDSQLHPKKYISAPRFVLCVVHGTNEENVVCLWVCGSWAEFTDLAEPVSPGRATELGHKSTFLFISVKVQIYSQNLDFLNDVFGKITTRSYLAIITLVNPHFDFLFEPIKTRECCVCKTNHRWIETPLKVEARKLSTRRDSKRLSRSCVQPPETY